MHNKESVVDPSKANKRQAPAVKIDLELELERELAGLRLLIIEDVGMIATELRLTLELLGCRIVGVASRLKAATTLAKTSENLDGVLLDLNLAGESAYPVAEVLQDRGIPFIIMSGYDISHLQCAWVTDAYLLKPFNHEDLKKKMCTTFLPRKNS